jgi:hypothetical protein
VGASATDRSRIRTQATTTEACEHTCDRGLAFILADLGPRPTKQRLASIVLDLIIYFYLEYLQRRIIALSTTSFILGFLKPFCALAASHGTAFWNLELGAIFA